MKDRIKAIFDRIVYAFIPECKMSEGDYIREMEDEQLAAIIKCPWEEMDTDTRFDVKCKEFGCVCYECKLCFLKEEVEVE